MGPVASFLNHFSQIYAQKIPEHLCAPNIVPFAVEDITINKTGVSGEVRISVHRKNILNNADKFLVGKFTLSDVGELSVPALAGDELSLLITSSPSGSICVFEVGETQAKTLFVDGALIVGVKCQTELSVSKTHTKTNNLDVLSYNLTLNEQTLIRSRLRQQDAYSSSVSESPYSYELINGLGARVFRYPRGYGSLTYYNYWSGDYYLLEPGNYTFIVNINNRYSEQNWTMQVRSNKPVTLN